MNEQEVITYWTHKIDEQCKWLDAHQRQREDEIRERNKHSKIQVDLSIARIIPRELYEETKIPVQDFEILQRNNIELNCCWWSCVSGSRTYSERCKMTFFENSSFHVAVGTPIEGYYKVVRIEENNVFCFYNSTNADEFVSQEVRINKYQLFAHDSRGNKSSINEGDIVHVESLQLINNRYAVKWLVL